LFYFDHFSALIGEVRELSFVVIVRSTDRLKVEKCVFLDRPPLLFSSFSFVQTTTYSFALTTFVLQPSTSTWRSGAHHTDRVMP
jgi:hypothetical protein